MSYVSNYSIAEEKVVAIDFDGVIHDNYKGFADGTIYGMPIEDSIESLRQIHKMGYIIKIYTCKSHPSRPLINNKTGTELVWEWLKDHKLEDIVTQVTWGKPHALVYIDDKAYRFENWKNTMNFLENIHVL